MLPIRRIIDGKIYDTETADLVAIVAEHGTPFRDFDADRTRLYKTRKRGAWFLAGEGGAASRWRKPASDGDGWVHGAGIQLISPSEAQKLLEQIDGPVEEHFSVEEG